MNNLIKAADDLADLLNDMIEPNTPLRLQWDEKGRDALTAYHTNPATLGGVLCVTARNMLYPV